MAAGLLVLFLGFCAMLGDDPPSSTSTRPSVYSGIEAPSTPPEAREADSTELLYVHDALNVRTAPDPNATRVRTLSRGDVVRLGHGDGSGWAPLYDASGRREGYVYRASGRVQLTAPPAAPSVETAPSSTGGRRYHIGPRGGCYTYSASGRKRYVDRSYCY